MAEAEEDEQFPGLNKRHGFFKVIEKNQTARGEFHQKQEEWLEQRRQNVESQYVHEKQERRKKRRERLRPDKQVYQPPRARSFCYRFEIEVQPGVIWKEYVTKTGTWEQLAENAAIKFKLDMSIKMAIQSYLEEFEQSLT